MQSSPASNRRLGPLSTNARPLSTTSSYRQYLEATMTPQSPQTPTGSLRHSFRLPSQYPSQMPPAYYQVTDQHHDSRSSAEADMTDDSEPSGCLVFPRLGQYTQHDSRPPTSFYNAVVTQSTPRSHRRSSSISNSIKQGMRSLGRRLSISQKVKDEQEEAESSQRTQPEATSLQPHHRPEVSRCLFGAATFPRQPSMPLLRTSSDSGSTDPFAYLHVQPDRTLRQRPSFHRSATVERAELLQGGAGARASAAQHNESIGYARATPLPPYRPRSRSQSPIDNKDAESGIEIVLHDFDHRHSRGPRKVDPVEVLAPELLEQIMAYLDAETLLQLELVSQKWRAAIDSQTVWKTAFLAKYAPAQPRRRRDARKQAGIGKGRRGEDYRNLYKVRTLLDKRWSQGQAAAYYLSGHKDSVYCVQFDEDKIITGSRDQTVRVWDARTYQCIRKLGPPTQLHHRDRNSLVVQESPPSGPMVPFHRVDVHAGEPATQPLPIWHSASVLCLAYDDSALVTGSSDFSAIVWSIHNNYEPIFQLQGHRAGVLDVAIDPQRIITCSKDTTIKVWNRFTGQLLQTLTGHQGPVNAVQVRSNLLASASGDGCARLWRLDTGKCIKEFHSARRGLACVEFSEDGRSLYAGGNDHVIYEYDTATGMIRRELSGHEALVRSLHLDTANGRMISGSYDHSIKVWSDKKGTNSRDGGLSLDLRGWTSSWVLGAKSDYRRIVAGGQDGKVLVVDFGFGIRDIDTVQA